MNNFIDERTLDILAECLRNKDSKEIIIKKTKLFKHQLSSNIKKIIDIDGVDSALYLINDDIIKKVKSVYKENMSATDVRLALNDGLELVDIEIAICAIHN